MQTVIDLAMQLIACPSITPVDAGCQILLSERLARAGFHCEAMRFNDVDNLWARYGNKAPLLVFAGHTDVVPPGPAADWRSPPFQPTIRDDHLYGRGATDMKAAIAAMVIAAENFIQKTPDFPGSIAFLITSDEEGQSIDGTKKVIERLVARKEKIDYCLIGEPSSLHHLGDQVRIGRRGSLHGSLTVHGKQGHVAHPQLAKNPIHQSLLALHELAHREWDKGNENFPPTTFQITNIASGTGAANVIPGHLHALFNFRFGTAITVEELKNHTRALFDAQHLTYALEWTLGAEPFLTRQGKLMTATAIAIKKMTGQTVRLSTGGGTSDGRFIAPLGAEIVELGTSHATAHQVNECVAVADLMTLTQVYEEILQYLF